MSNQEQDQQDYRETLPNRPHLDPLSNWMGVVHEVAPWTLRGLAYLLKKAREFPDDIDRGTNSTW